MALPNTDLPYVDTQRTRIAKRREVVWNVLRHYADAIGIGENNPLSLALGTQPRSGFKIMSEVPSERIDLTGRHRFARYLLVFDLTDAADEGTLLSAHTYAAFPGPAGRLYRALVISTGFHGVATRSMLYSIERRCAG
jgi:hypothetical protein